MKLIKFSIIALVLTVSAQFAKAQVRVGASIHIGYNQPRRVVYPAYYEEPAPVYYEQPVYVNRPVYYRPAYRRAYYRPQYRREVYRENYYEGRGRGREDYYEGRGKGHGHGNGWGRGGRRW